MVVLLVSHTVWGRMQNESDAVVDWLMDQSATGGARFLGLVKEPLEGDDPLSLDLDTLRTLDSAYMCLLGLILDKFGFGGYLYPVPRGRGFGYSPGLQQRWRDHTQRDGSRLYLCGRSALHGSSYCAHYGCLPLRRDVFGPLREEDLGPHLWSLVSFPLTEAEEISLRIVIACSYLGVLLASTRQPVSDQVKTVRDLCSATYLSVSSALATE